MVYVYMCVCVSIHVYDGVRVCVHMVYMYDGVCVCRLLSESYPDEVSKTVDCLSASLTSLYDAHRITVVSFYSEVGGLQCTCMYTCTCTCMCVYMQNVASDLFYIYVYYTCLLQTDTRTCITCTYNFKHRR